MDGILDRNLALRGAIEAAVADANRDKITDEAWNKLDQALDGLFERGLTIFRERYGAGVDPLATKNEAVQPVFAVGTKVMNEFVEAAQNKDDLAPVIHKNLVFAAMFHGKTNIFEFFAFTGLLIGLALGVDGNNGGK